MGSSGRWRGNQEISGQRELHAKTVGIVGLGNIGKRVAPIASGVFAARIEYYDMVPRRRSGGCRRLA
jgi:lactate dehydrogenase-like 2-hydroxyacid dehydrogenase